MHIRRRLPLPWPLLLLAVGALLAAGGSAEPIGLQLTTEERRSQGREVRLAVDLIQNYHYSDRTLSEIDARELLERFLGDLDPRRWFLTRADTDFVNRRFARSLKTVYLLRGDLRPAFEIYDVFAERARARLDWIQQRLGAPVGTGTPEALPPDLDETPAADAAEADRRWELRLRDQLITEIVAGRTREDAVAELRRRYARLRLELDATDALRVRERFFEVLAEQFDPHSGYFAADSAKEFAVEMAGSVAGIGVDLRKDGGVCRVTTVAPGGPADRAGDLQAGDQIEGIGEGDGPLVPTAGMRLREILARVRGQPGTKVRVAFRAPDAAQAREATLERAQVILPPDRARGLIAAVADSGGHSRRIGCLFLPAFYAAGEKGEVASATRDLRELITQMSAAGVDGLVLDLRGNPGGALPEAVAAAGLFLPEGRILLTRGLDGVVNEFRIEKPDVAYAGPVVVLTSRDSASASEIVSAALSFHRRAIIVGTGTTFGKGTVQTFVDLAKLPAATGASPDWGVLRLTIQRLYRPDGLPIQRTGAVSDVVLPAYEPPDAESEAGLPHALAAETIAPPSPAAPAAGDFARVTPELLDRLRVSVAADLANLPEFALRRREIELAGDLAARRERSLSLAERQQAWAREQARRESLRRERRALAASAAFPEHAIEIAAVRSVIAAEADSDRLPLPDGAARAGRLHHGIFYARIPGGGVREVRMDAIDFSRFTGDTAALAAACAAATGRAVDAPAMARLLAELGLLERRTDAAVLACMAGRLGEPSADDALAGRGLAAFLQCLVEVDPDLVREWPALDVSLRESLRLAARWAEARASTGAPPTLPPATPSAP